jgi:hypothetical protein
MPKGNRKNFGINWTYGGTTYVEATDEAEAYEKFDAMDKLEILKEAIEDDSQIDPIGCYPADP